ncbi:melanocortin receptor 3-like [Saccostrea echinata]|uniref:melanocortin receptor 3-like n=1 Tax=Saccostrea echinata TaxID=191078 RepID=UPI002A80871C|nr:melanocortin receptor 3-like [Saccostrea echinata]
METPIYFPFDLDKLPTTLNTTVIPYNGNTTGLYANFVNIINSTTWANLQPQNIHERADDIFTKPENIITLILCFLALAVNAISIAATAHIPHGLTNHSKLIISLAVSDILVTLSVFMHILIKVVVAPIIPPTLDNVSERLTSACMFQFVNSINITAHLISLFNLFAMALDHYISVLQPLHYYHIMNNFRGNLMITILWVTAFVGGFSNFLAGFGKTDKDDFVNFCEYTLYSEYQAEYIVIIMALICLVSILFIYIRIYREVKQINAKCVMLLKDGLHNKKALRTTLLIIGTFVVCWLPSMTFQIAMIIQVHVNTETVKKLFTTLIRANKYLYALLLVNSLTDPIIYAVRLKDVQNGYFRLLSRCSKFYQEKVKEEIYSQSRIAFNSKRRSTENTIKFLLTDCNSNQPTTGIHRDTSAPLLCDNDVVSEMYSLTRDIHMNVLFQNETAETEHCELHALSCQNDEENTVQLSENTLCDNSFVIVSNNGVQQPACSSSGKPIGQVTSEISHCDTSNRVVDNCNRRETELSHTVSVHMPVGKSNLPSGKEFLCNSKRSRYSV